MRVIEQLVQHFWARGAITRDEALYLAKHGFVKETDLPGLVEDETKPEPKPSPQRPARDDRPPPDEETRAIEAEQLEDELVGRQGGGKKGGKKKKPSGHNLAPAVAVLAGHFADREPYPALVELGSRLRRCRDWHAAARAVAAADPADLEAALVGLLSARPRALGELWHWFDIEPLFTWAEDAANAGPVADALAKLMRAATPAEVGRIGQLMKAAEVAALIDLLAARRAFLRMLPVLYHNHFASLARWLVPPAGAAADRWPALPWAIVLVYNAMQGTRDTPPPGYEVKWQTISFALLTTAMATAYTLAPVAFRELLIHRLRNRDDPLPNFHDWATNAVFDRPLYCPYMWRI
jgi:hypothetical protein